MAVPIASPTGVGANQKSKRPVSNKPHITDQVIFATVLYFKVRMLTIR